MSDRRSLLIGAAAALVVTMLYTIIVLRPKIAEISATREQVAQAQDEESRLRAEITRLESIRKNDPATMARLARISEALPSTPQLPAFIRVTQEAATLAGVDLKSIAPSQPSALTGATGVETITVTLMIEGAFARIQDFLARMEGLPRIVEIRALSLSPEVDALSTATVLASTLSLTMYVVEPDARLTAGASSGGTSPSPSPSPEASR